MTRGGRGWRRDYTIYGDDGDNILDGRDYLGSSFNLIGGEGDDTYYVDDTGDKVVEKNHSGTDFVESSIESYTLGKFVENLTLVDGAISGTGNDSDNIIIGNSGDNTLQGLGGDDTLDGAAGDDLIDGGDGTDTAVFVGSYNDYEFKRVGTDLHVTYKTGETDILRNIEFLSFSDIVIAESEIGDGPGDLAVLLAVADAATVAEDDSIVIAVLANDSGVGLAITSASNGANGQATINADGTVTFTPNANANGRDSFSYTVADALGQTATATVTVTVSSVNDAPIAIADSYSATSGIPLTITESVLDNDSDPDGDALSVTDFDPISAGGGSVQMYADGTFTYVSAAGFSGPDSFSYTVSDGIGGEDSTLVIIEVAAAAPVNNAPVALGDSYSTVAGVALNTGSVLVNDSDPDGNPLSVIAYDTTSTGGGSVQMSADGTFTYVSAGGFTGTDSFSYTVSDGNGGEDSAVVTIEVAAAPANNEPVAVDDSYSTVAGVALNAGSVLANDIDPDGNQLSVIAYDTTSTGGGSVQMSTNGTFTYTPTAVFTGADSFTYTISDGNGGQASATVTINVEAAPPPPPPPPPDPEDPPYYVEGLLYSQEWRRLNYPDDVGTGVVVTYAFLKAVPDYYSEGSPDQFNAFTAQQEQVTRDALALIESFSNITFVETTVDAAGLTFGLAYLGGLDGLAYKPLFDGVGSTASDVWLDATYAGDALVPGTAPYTTLLHELAHAIGLSHASLPAAENTEQYTVMGAVPHLTMSGVDVYQLYDIAALQYLYGANTSFATGDDVYGFNSLDGAITTIWDAGGHDVIDMSGATYAVDLDLAEGAFSTVTATGSNNLAIAFGTVIEDAIGGAYDDRIAGNEAANRLTGGGGDDELTGRGGLDVFAFTVNWGNDTITDFARGEDRLDFSEAGLTFAKLDINSSAGNTVIAYGENSVTLQGVATIDESDFNFV